MGNMSRSIVMTSSACRSDAAFSMPEQGDESLFQMVSEMAPSCEGLCKI